MTSTTVNGARQHVAFPELPLIRMPLWKRIFDVVAASLGIVLLTPVFVLVSLAIVVESWGSPLYRHQRVGRGGKIFTCWKFRSMHVGADKLLEELRERNEANGNIFKIRNDPRRTRVGTVLRKIGLDETPQLWNVLRGDMSLVGPRPPLPGEVEEYEPHHFERLRGVPGVTGLWQVTARDKYNFEDMVRLDREYLARLGPRIDAEIVLRTIPTMLLGRGS
jgi:lipopolysaccharide/colanic/teichoic acid biosynthesis glycosyltransferase